MVPLSQLDAKSIMSRDVLEEVFSQEDEVYRAEMLADLALRASELRCKAEFKQVVAAYKRAEREIKKQEAEEKKRNNSLMEHFTNFTDCPYDNMACENWIASDDGVYTWNPLTGLTDIRACYHPILPVERLKNLETGEEQIKLAFKRNYAWQEIIIPKTIVTSASKIVNLSGRGISVTSETAKYLVRYLSDVENANDDYINVQYSSSKLGWIGDYFLPYDTDIIFDGDGRFKQLFESIETEGDRELWYSCVKQIRKSGRLEAKFMLAASFSSILVSLIGALPYFVDLWGETEGGKTVSLMLAASIWACPDDSRYIGDFKTTDVALEAKADMLNSLPMILDDTSKTSARIRENFEGIVYDLCSGKGKSRSNKELGINRENRWKNCILTNGERPLQSYVNQGGAINRILEVECGSEKIYRDPQGTVDVLKKNYGFAGRDFVKAVKEMGTDRVRKIQQEFMRELSSDDKMQKQAISLSIILTADKIATDRLFWDGCYISIDEAKETLVDRSEVSDNERCYLYFMDKIAMNEQKFDYDTHCEKWGETKYDTGLGCKVAILYNHAVNEICKDGGFSKKAFLSWAAKKELVICQGGDPTKVKKVDGKARRCVFLKIVDDLEEYLKALGTEPEFEPYDGPVFE